MQVFKFTQETKQKLIDTRNKSAHLDETLDAFAEFMAFGTEGADPSRDYEMYELNHLEEEVFNTLSSDFLEKNTDDQVVNESAVWAKKYLSTLDSLPGNPNSLDDYEDRVKADTYQLLVSEIAALDSNLMQVNNVLRIAHCEGTLKDFVNALAHKTAGQLPDENHTSMLTAIEDTEIAVSLALAHLSEKQND